MENSSTSGDSRYRVFSRIRPSKDSVVEILDGRRVRVQNGDGRVLDLRFNGVLTPEASQEDVFAAVKPTILEPLCAERNATILAYGPTGSGKTYTILGDEKAVDCARDAGLVPRCLRELLSLFPLISVSMMELYNDALIDLLDPGSNLEIRVTPKYGVQVPDVTTVQCTSYKHAMGVLSHGCMNRRVGDNGVNATSSRGHSVFQIKVGGSSSGSTTTVLNLVDLAGSEKHAQSMFRRTFSAPRRVVSADVMVELTFINQSLSALGHCISALVARQKYVPYRNSKLTTLLKDSLGGQSHCCMIVCVNPTEEFIDETMQALKFADRAKKLRMSVNKPVPVHGALRGLTVEKLMQVIESLKNELTVERSKNLNLQMKVEQSQFQSGCVRSVHRRRDYPLNDKDRGRGDAHSSSGNRDCGAHLRRDYPLNDKDRGRGNAHSSSGDSDCGAHLRRDYPLNGKSKGRGNAHSSSGDSDCGAHLRRDYPLNDKDRGRGNAHSSSGVSDSGAHLRRNYHPNDKSKCRGDAHSSSGDSDCGAHLRRDYHPNDKSKCRGDDHSSLGNSDDADGESCYDCVLGHRSTHDYELRPNPFFRGFRCDPQKCSLIQGLPARKAVQRL